MLRGGYAETSWRLHNIRPLWSICDASQRLPRGFNRPLGGAVRPAAFWLARLVSATGDYCIGVLNRPMRMQQVVNTTARLGIICCKCVVKSSHSLLLSLCHSNFLQISNVTTNDRSCTTAEAESHEQGSNDHIIDHHIIDHHIIEQTSVSISAYTYIYLFNLT